MNEQLRLIQLGFSCVSIERVEGKSETASAFLQHAQDTVSGSGGGQVLEGVTTYDVPRREDWFVEGLQTTVATRL